MDLTMWEVNETFKRHLISKHEDERRQEQQHWCPSHTTNSLEDVERGRGGIE
jgi:hypothetical protein